MCLMLKQSGRLSAYNTQLLNDLVRQEICACHLEVGFTRLRFITENNQVTFIWRLEHQDIEGNEQADALAKAGSKEGLMDAEAGRPGNSGIRSSK
ncbi:hypothetical protein SEPCBS119000_003573 [Sporothrix epigloea]|uniref:RNase H type-1 domain-containing protein n=1 Tax=Sporothrix epigloea TaxID=1892477 RepID=A0ABP0DMD7_9PEZI